MPADLREIKTKLKEAEAELKRIKTLKQILGSNIATDTYQKLEQSEARAKGVFEQCRIELWEALIGGHLLKKSAEIESLLPEVNLETWQATLNTLESLKK